MQIAATTENVNNSENTAHISNKNSTNLDSKEEILPDPNIIESPNTSSKTMDMPYPHFLTALKDNVERFNLVQSTNIKDAPYMLRNTSTSKLKPFVGNTPDNTDSVIKDKNITNIESFQHEPEMKDITDEFFEAVKGI